MGNSFMCLSYFLLWNVLAPNFEKTVIQRSNRQLYVCMDDLAPASVTSLKKYDIPIIKIVYENFIDPDHDGKLNLDVFQKRIQTLFPKKNESGMAIIDWEAKDFDKLPNNSSKFGSLVSEYRKAIRAAKKLRPNVKWGFYGLPFRKYMSYNADWRNRNLKLAPILKESDFIAPSLYGFFPDSVRRKDNQDYVINNVSLALQIGNQLNKPVYPFVWNRWHNSNKEYGLQLIPVHEFKGHIERILSVSYNEKKVAGIIWWGADRFFYNQKAQVLMNEQSHFKSFNDYQHNTINTYARALLDIFQ